MPPPPPGPGAPPPPGDPSRPRDPATPPRTRDPATPPADGPEGNGPPPPAIPAPDGHPRGAPAPAPQGAPAPAPQGAPLPAPQGAATDAVHLLPHVPKCAGTTVEQHLAAHLGPGLWLPARRARAWPIELMGRKYAGSPPDPGAVRAAAGHYLGASAAARFPGRPIWRGVLLRDPAALMLSWFNYRMMRYLAAGRRPYPFALHLAATPPDPISHFLLERWGELPWPALAALGPGPKRARLDTMLGGFDVVADIAACDRLIATLSDRLGIPAQAAPRNTAESWARSVDWRPVGLADLDAATRASLAARTRLDTYVWRRWALGDTPPFDPALVTPFLPAELARPLAELRRRRARG